ncbi:MAG: ABC transporter ATP-binding protein [Schleiferilactobacillus harbinensis]
MNRLAQLTWFFYRVKVTTSANGLLYFLRRIPFVGKLISPAVYGFLGVKKFFAVIAAIGRILMRAAFGFLAFALSFLGSDLYITNYLHQPPLPALHTSAMLAATVWLVAFSALRGLFPSRLSVDPEALKTADQFGLSRQETIHVSAVSSFFAGLLSQGVLPLAIFAAMTQNPWLFLNGLGFFTLTMIWQQFTPRWGWQHQLRVRLGGVIYWLALVAAPLVLAILRQYQQLLTILFSPLAAVIVWLLVGLGTYYWLTFKNEPALLTKTILDQKAALAEVSETKNKNSEYFSTGTAMQKDMTLDTPKGPQASRLTGSNYLNALLFTRYRKQLRHKLAIRAGLVALAGIAVLAAFKLFSNGRLPVKDLTEVYGFLFFIMYLASFGRPIVQMLFVNCDAAMLYYPFYRQRRTILAGFFYRFWRTFLLNSGIGALMFVLFLGLYLVTPDVPPITFYLVLALELLGLVLFFSFHELFMYYLLQPFTADMNVVSPLYKFVYGAMYWVSWMVLRSNLQGYGYAIVIGAAALVYVAVGTVIIYFKAPQTFRVRN